MGIAVKRTNKPDEPDGHSQQVGHRHPHWRRKLVIGVITAAAIAGIVMAGGMPASETGKAPADRVDLGGSFCVSPTRLYLGDETEGEVIVHNRSDKLVRFTLTLATPLGLTEGYAAWDDTYSLAFAPSVVVPAGESVVVPVTLTMNRGRDAQEAWLVVAEPKKDGHVAHELAVRILVVVVPAGESVLVNG